jgi:hypothetical protein
MKRNICILAWTGPRVWDLGLHVHECEGWEFKSSGIWCRVVWILMFEGLMIPLLQRSRVQEPWRSHVSTESTWSLKLKASWSFGMPGTTWLTWCHIPEDLNPQQYYCENLKFSVSVKSAVCLAATACIVVVGYLSVCLEATLHYVKRLKTFYNGRVVPVNQTTLCCISECGSLQNHGWSLCSQNLRFGGGVLVVSGLCL